MQGRKAPPAHGAEAGDRATATVIGPPDGVPLDEIVDKGLDLAEKGIGIGFNIATRLGAMIKDQVIDRINAAQLQNAAVNAPAAGAAVSDPGPVTDDRAAASSGQDAAQDGAAVRAACLYNRRSLQPGDEAAVSFSINNDSVSEDRRIRIGVEGFSGETRGATLDAAMFSVTPGEITIAPADFEKFVLKGRIPAEAPADHYHGWLIVTEQDAYRIPVILVVSVPDPPSTNAAI